jgi:hypothetical protein
MVMVRSSNGCIRFLITLSIVIFSCLSRVGLISSSEKLFLLLVLVIISDPLLFCMLEILKQLRGGGGVNQLFISLNNFIPFKTVIKNSSCVINQSYTIWTVRVKIISHT